MIAFRERVQGSRPRRSEGERLEAERKARERVREREREGKRKRGVKHHKAKSYIVHRPPDRYPRRPIGRSNIQCVL